MEKLLRLSILVLASTLLQPAASFAVTRFNTYLDNGSTVTVDNASSWSNYWVSNLVLAADRSTQEGCPYDTNVHKGLFKTGDRIFVNDNYLAWFDFTANDGVAFNMPPYSATWHRSGELAGYWTLDPETTYFRYWKTGPDGCWNWAHNELIPGSASPNQEQHWWDKYAPPTEHVLGVLSGSSSYFMAYHYAKQTSNSQWAMQLDGFVDSASGVHYKSTARMTSWTSKVDIVDGNDSNGISNYIQAELEYICLPDEIVSIWKFKPNNANVVLNNSFIFLWTAYVQEEDNTSCDVASGTSEWPTTVYGAPMYNQSSKTLKATFNPGASYAPGTIVQMVLGPTCPSPHFNQDIYTDPPFTVTDGSWIRTGEASDLSVGSPRLQYTHLGVPNTGTGTPTDPYSFAWERLISWNETRDGTLGFGAVRGPYFDSSQYVTLLSGKWYQAAFSLRSNF